MILTPLWEAGKSCRAGRYSCDQAAAAEEVKRAAGGTGDSGEHAPWVRRGIRGEEGILWGMPGESRGTLRAAPCACVELISSPLPSSLLSAAALSLFRVPECWQHQRRARSPSGPGPAASSRPPTLFSSSLRLRLCVSLSFFLSLFFLTSPSRDSSFSLRYIFQFLLSSRYLRLFTLLRLIFPIPAPTNKTLSLSLPLPVYLSSSLSHPSFSLLHPLPLWHVSSSPLHWASHVLRLTSYIPNTVSTNKAVFRKSLWIPQNILGNRVSIARSHKVAIACFVGSMSNSWVEHELTKCRIISRFLIRFLEKRSLGNTRRLLYLIAKHYL